MNPDTYLSGNYAPVRDELDISNLKIIGDIPTDLNGIYMRNGPNPQFTPISYTYPFDGDGMIHAIYLKDGKAHYRNRFVETRGLLKERKAGKALYGGILNLIPLDPEWADEKDEPLPLKEGPTIHIIRHAGKYLAMSEGAPAYEMTRDLATVGEWNPTHSTPLSVCPHTRRDPINGDLWFVNYSLTPPFLSLYCVDAKGIVTKAMDIEKSHCSMVHDFTLTQNYIVIFDCPLVLDINQLMSGGPIAKWHPEMGSRIGLIPRHGGNIRWLETEPFFVFHFANAYECNNEIIVDYVRHARCDLIEQSVTEPPSIPTLYRSIINLDEGTIAHSQLDNRLVEFPRFRDDYNTRPHQFIYTPTRTSNVAGEKIFNAIIKYDVLQQTSQIFDFGRFGEIDEAVFVPAINGHSEDDGYLMLFVFDAQKVKSEFVILNAGDLASEPLARVQMPRRVPHGLHGSWMPV